MISDLWFSAALIGLLGVFYTCDMFFLLFIHGEWLDWIGLIGFQKQF